MSYRDGKRERAMEMVREREKDLLRWAIETVRERAIEMIRERKSYGDGTRERDLLRWAIETVRERERKRESYEDGKRERAMEMLRGREREWVKEKRARLRADVWGRMRKKMWFERNSDFSLDSNKDRIENWTFSLSLVPLRSAKLSL